MNFLIKKRAFEATGLAPHDTTPRTDADFFNDHPGIHSRIRPAVQGEFGSTVSFPINARVLVTRIGQGVSARRLMVDVYPVELLRKGVE